MTVEKSIKLLIMFGKRLRKILMCFDIKIDRIITTTCEKVLIQEVWIWSFSWQKHQQLGIEITDDLHS